MLFGRELVTAACECGRRRWWSSASAVFPVLLVALLPKCPICLAAWIAAGTGVGISVGAAGWLRGAAVILGLAPAAYVLIRGQGRRARLGSER